MRAGRRDRWQNSVPWTSRCDAAQEAAKVKNLSAATDENASGLRTTDTHFVLRFSHRFPKPVAEDAIETAAEKCKPPAEHGNRQTTDQNTCRRGTIANSCGKIRRAGNRADCDRDEHRIPEPGQCRRATSVPGRANLRTNREQSSRPLSGRGDCGKRQISGIRESVVSIRLVTQSRPQR